MPKSKSYDAISGLEGNSYVFDFRNDTDGEIKLIGIYKDDKILNPDLDEWIKAKDSDEAESAYNIFKNGVAVEA
tara:strand:+ start:117 stop:338 length:222 start_codon:yes stop_codon:yes gene_type:complete